LLNDTPRPPSWAALSARPAASESRCPFCFPAAIAPNQLLAATEHFYLLAPAGQMVEGFLGIMTHVCRDGAARLRCLDDVPAHWVTEMRALRNLVIQFYADVYHTSALFYEHGRGGGTASSPPGGDFVFHPHLCALPADLDLHQALRARFHYRRSPQYPSVRTRIGCRPYLYVDAPKGPHYRGPVVYYAADEPNANSLISFSMKRLLAELNSIDKDWNWRRYPGERELVALVEKFNLWYATGFRRQSDPDLEVIFGRR